MAAHIQTACRSSLFLKKSNCHTTEQPYKYPFKHTSPKKENTYKRLKFLIFPDNIYKYLSNKKFRSPQALQRVLLISK